MSRPLATAHRTVRRDVWVIAKLATLAALRLVPVVALVIGVIDLASAALTAWALVAEARRRLE